MMAGKIMATFKNTPTGSIAGGIGGLLLGKSISNRFIVIVPAIFIGALIGSSLEYKMKNPKIKSLNSSEE